MPNSSPIVSTWGADESPALATALELQKQWAELTRKGESAWSIEFLRRFNGQNVSAAPLTIAAAKEKYVAHLKARANAQQITTRHVEDET